MIAAQMKHLLPMVLCIALVGCSKSPSQIRVQNLTGRDFAKVAVMTNAFGAVRAGETTEYRRVQAMFEEASVFTSETNGWFRNARFMGGANPSLSSDSYTYILTLKTNDMLEVTLKRD